MPPRPTRSHSGASESKASESVQQVTQPSQASQGAEEEKAAEPFTSWEQLERFRDSDFDKWWNGLDELSGDGQGYIDAANWWNRVPAGYKAQVAKACVVFFDKPPAFLATGKVKRAGVEPLSRREMIDERLSSFLPKIAGGYQPGLVVDKREHWRTFRDVNLSMTRRIAKMLIVREATEYPIVKKWISKYGGPLGKIKADSTGYKKVCASATTKAIFDAHAVDVVAYKDRWDSIFKTS